MFVHVPYVFVTKQNALTDGEFINKFLYIIFWKIFPNETLKPMKNRANF